MSGHSADDALPGSSESRYQVLFELAAGGMGRVSLARVRGTAGFQRLVALKTIHPQFANEPRFQEMFFEEARLAAGIHHPNVVPVLDLGEHGGTFFLAMEYVPGEALSRVIARCLDNGTRIPLGVSLRWLADACAGLHAAHELRDPQGRTLGLVHRDVSPANLIVTEHGSCMLTDFGIAKALTTRDHTAVGALKGKVGYLSPEQVLGKKPDRRSDVFSLGVILFEVTTMRKLFGAMPHVKAIEAIASAEYPDPRTLVPGYPDALAEVVRTALARDRGQRYPTAEAMGAALERVERTLPAPMVAVDVTGWVRDHFGSDFEARRQRIAEAMTSLDGSLPVTEPTVQDMRPLSASIPTGTDVQQFDVRANTITGLGPPSVTSVSRTIETGPPVPYPIGASPLALPADSPTQQSLVAPPAGHYPITQVAPPPIAPRGPSALAATAPIAAVHASTDGEASLTSITVERGLAFGAHRNAIRVPAIVGIVAAAIIGIVVWRWPASQTGTDAQTVREATHQTASAPMLVPSAYPSLPTEPRTLGATPTVVTAPINAPALPVVANAPPSAPMVPLEPSVTQPATNARSRTPHHSQSVVRTRSEGHTTPQRHRDGTFRPADP